MKTLGLLGGMSWESTTLYYQLINRRVRERLGGLHSAKCIVYSFDFAEIEALQAQERWEEAGGMLADAAGKLRGAGAEGIVLCTNTMHIVGGGMEGLLHIADCTGRAIVRKGCRRVGLLGTRFTMEREFYKERLVGGFGLEVVVPEGEDRDAVHRIIYDELCNGVVREESRTRYQEVIGRLKEKGAEGVILGCTEIGMLIDAGNSPLPVFDTTELHAVAAADWALDGVAA